MLPVVMSNRVNLADIPARPEKVVTSLPVSTRLQRLPLGELTWENFERLCVRLVSKDADAEFAQAYGVRGQNQEGIDLYVRKRSNGLYTVWQCKRYEKFDKADVGEAVQRFIKALKSKEAAIQIREADALVLAVTADLATTTVAKEVESQNKRLQRRFKVALIPCDIQGLSDRLKAHSDIVADFFGPVWVEEFCGIKQTAVLGSEFERAVTQTALRTAQEGLSSYGSAELDRIRDLWGERREEEALSGVAKFKADPTWPLLSPDVKAKALRIEAGLLLQRADAVSARKLFEEARRIAPDANARILEGRLIHHDQGPEAALAFIDHPTTDDERVFRWNLLLELGRPQEVTHEFSALHRQEVPAGDFSAVLAIAQLAQFDVTAADRTIRAALQKKPRHANSRYVAAVVDYYWGISPAFRAWQHLTWPVPPPWNLVKRDKTSYERRRRAGQLFEELAATAPKFEASEMQVWQFACVALNSTDAHEPTKLIQALLAENPTNCPLLVWTSALGLEVDTASSITALRLRFKDGGGTLDDLLVLLGLLDDVGDQAEYEDLLTHHRHIFATAGREPLWFFHLAKVLIDQGKTVDAVQLMESLPKGEESPHIRTAVLNLVAESTRKKEDYLVLLKAQEEAYKANQTPETLVTCCRTSRLLQNWNFIAEHADELISEVGTQSALEMAAESLLQAQRAKECLNALERNRELCEGGEWSPFLRQVAAQAHRLLGNLPAAIQELQRAADAGKDLAAGIQLFNMLLLKGDLPGALQIARSLTSSPRVPPEFIIGQVVPIARHHDLEFAKELILKMAEAASELPPHAQAKLMEEAHRADVESVSRELTAKLTHQAIKGEGPLKAFTYEQTRQLLIDTRNLTGNLLTLYARGEIPAHFLCSGSNLPMARLLHEAPRLNIKTGRLLHAHVVFTRYASDSNAQPRQLPSGVKELYLDVSSFLLLDALGMLPSLEAALDHLHVGSSLVQVLEEHLDQLSPRQPPRALAREQIIQLLDTSKLKVCPPAKTLLPDDSPLASLVPDLGAAWSQRLLQVHSESGLFVGFLPLHSRSDIDKLVSLPGGISSTVISVFQLIHAMQQAGWVSGRETSRDISGPPSAVPAENPICLRDGMTVHLDSGMAEELAVCRILPTLCERAQVTIDTDEASRLRDEISSQHTDEELKKEIHRLLAHISNGIGKSKYLVHTGKPIVRTEGEPATQAPERALYEAIDFGERGDIPVCIDDRNVLRHLRIGKAPLCDSWDLLHHLHSSDAITDDAFQGTRSRMRAANLRYLPISPEEILSCIRAAPIQNGELKETPDLSSLRRHVSACLLDIPTLQDPLCDANGNMQPREGFWAARLQAAVSKALADLWLESTSATNQTELQADWVWFNLCFDERLGTELLERTPDGGSQDRVAHLIAYLFGQGVALYDFATDQAPGATRRKRYFQWLTDRVVTPLLPNNPELWHRTGSHIRKIFPFTSQKLRDSRADTEKWIIRHVVASFIADLPAALADSLQFSPTELEALGLTSSNPGIETMGLLFPARDFWEAIARAMKQKHAVLWTPDRRNKLRIRFNGTTNEIGISSTGASNSPWRVLRIPFLALLSGNQKWRESELRREAAGLDLDEPEISEAIREVSSIHSASDRVAKYTGYRNRSAVALYSELRERISDGKRVFIDDLFPEEVDCLRRYLRLELTDRTLEEFTDRLLEKRGWLESLIRLSRLPTRFPPKIIESWGQFSTDEQNTLLMTLEETLLSPIERLHVLELVCNPATIVSDRVPRAQAQINWLTDDKQGVACTRAMLSVVRWVHLRLGWHERTSKWPAFIRLCVAWSHGCALHRAFQTAGARHESVVRWFAGNSQEVFAERFTSTDSVASDASNPEQLKESTLILKGVVAACGSLSDGTISDLALQQKLASLMETRSFLDHIDLWLDRSTSVNLMGSYLAQTADEDLKRVVGDAAFAQRFRIEPQPLAEHALETLLSNPCDEESMRMLLIIGDRPMYDPLRVKVSKVLLNVDVPEVFETRTNLCAPYIMFYSQLAVSSEDPALMDRIWAECLRLADRLAERNVIEAEISSQLALAFMDAAFRLSRSPLSREAGLRTTITRLTDLARRWPGFAKHHSPALIEVLNRVPVEESTGLQVLKLLLRANM